MSRLISSKSKYIFLALAAACMGTTAMAQDNPWQVRGRILGVYPDESGDLKVGGAALAGDVDINAGYVPELDITYFFTKNIAAELILGVTPHDVKATGVTVPGVLTDATIDLGDVTLLPPTLTLQYHFKNDSKFTPYIGAGINYTLFFDENAGPVADDISYGESIGGALQAGVDVDLDGVDGGWLLNVDIKKIWINSDVDVDFSSALGAGTVVKANVDINPTVLGVGFGYKF